MPFSSHYYSVLPIIFYTDSLCNRCDEQYHTIIKICCRFGEEKWKDFRKYLRNKNEKRMFRYIYSFGICRTLPLLMLLIQLESILLWSSIVFHHYNTLKEKNLFAKDYAVAFGFKIILKI